MTNILKEGPLTAIQDRARVFASQCAEAGMCSVDIYVS